MARLLRELRPHWKRMVLVFSGQAFEQIVQMVLPVFGGLALDAIRRSDPTEAYEMTGYGVAIWLGYSLINHRRYRQDLRLNYYIETHLEKVTLSRIRQFSIGQFRSLHSADVLTRVKNGQKAVWEIVKTFLLELIPQLFKILLAITILLVLDVRLGGPLALCIGFIILLNRMQNKKMRDPLREENRLNNDLNKEYTEIMQNMPLVLTSGHADHFLERHCDERDKLDEFGLEIWDRQLEFGDLRAYIVGTTEYALRAITFYLAAAGQLSFAMIAPAMTWIGNAASNLGMLQRAERNLLIWGIQAENYFEILDIPSRVAPAAHPVIPEKLDGEITFVNVSHVYKDVILDRDESENEESSSEALLDVSFTIRSGEQVAFVGPSGAGKSTLIGLVLRIDDPTKGAVLVDGKSLALYDLDWYHGNIGYVEQRITLFDESLRFNITLGKELSNEKIEEVIELSQLGGVKAKLLKDKGWDTPIGERGIKLSVGECQRLAIARALAKDPKIIILDEATSSLDTMSERLIQKALETVCKGRTTLMIAHRLSTVMHADTIYVVNGGRIEDSGNHGELQKSSQMYRELVRNQMLGVTELSSGTQLN